MSNKDNGGPAFPTSAEFFAGGDMACPPTYGMTLRDYFAAKAMQSHIAALSMANVPEWNSEIARLSFLVADAMLAERNKS